MPEELQTIVKEETSSPLKKGEYIEGIGRRKRAVARVRISPAAAQQSVEKRGFTLNNGKAEVRFPTKDIEVALEPLSKLKLLNKFQVSVSVRGGGRTGQAEAVRMGLARALVAFDPDFRKQLKTAGFLTRDPREKERRKYGLKKARRAPQWQKR